MKHNLVILSNNKDELECVNCHKRFCLYEEHIGFDEECQNEVLLYLEEIVKGVQ